jgi:sphinganine-1-phosphate aldolase
MEHIKDLYERATSLIPPTVSEHAAPYVAQLQSYAALAWQQTQPYVEQATTKIDEVVYGYEPWQLVVGTALLTALVLAILGRIQAYLRRVTEGGTLQWLFSVVRSLPLVSSAVNAPITKAKKDIAAKLATPDEETITTLPRSSTSPAAVVAALKQRSHKDVMFRDGQSSASGTVYMAGEAHKQLMDEAYSLFSYSNPLHADIFPSVRKMEAEVVAMTADMLGGGLCGNSKVGRAQSQLGTGHATPT